jgi:DNA polymerase III alpha subunit
MVDCVTDHGILDALAGHHAAFQKLKSDGKLPANFQILHGIEAYIIDPLRPIKISTRKDGTTYENPEYYHVTIHFKTKKAYEYFCRLTPVMEKRAVSKGGESKPLLTFAELEAISGEIIIGSGCLVGPVQRNVLRGRKDWAELLCRDDATQGDQRLEEGAAE